jgi:hypothetical protein
MRTDGRQLLRLFLVSRRFGVFDLQRPARLRCQRLNVLRYYRVFTAGRMFVWRRHMLRTRHVHDVPMQRQQLLRATTVGLLRRIAVQRVRTMLGVRQ